MRSLLSCIVAFCLTACGGTTEPAPIHGLPREFLMTDVAPGAEIAATIDSTMSLSTMTVTMLADGTFRMQTNYNVNYRGAVQGRPPRSVSETTDWSFTISGATLQITHPLDGFNNTGESIAWDDAARQVAFSFHRVYQPWQGGNVVQRTIAISQTN